MNHERPPLSGLHTAGMRWALGSTALIASLILAWWLADRLGLPYLGWACAVIAVAVLSHRPGRVNGHGIAVWLAAQTLAMSLMWCLQKGWTNGLTLLLAFAIVVLMLIAAMTFLATAIGNTWRRAWNCAACVFVVSSLAIPGVCASRIQAHARHIAQVEQTSHTFVALNRLSGEIESFRQQLGRLPAGEKELETLRGKPLPAYYEQYRIDYQRLGDDHYRLSCLLPSFWGYGWDLFGWDVMYHGTNDPRRIQIVLF